MVVRFSTFATISARSGRCHVGPSICREHQTNASAQGAAAGGSSESVTNLIDGQHRILKMGEVPYARKKSQFRAHSFGELYSHLLVDVEVFLAPNDLHGRLEPGKLRFEAILVSRKVRVVVGERVCRRHRSLGPSSEHVVLELTRNFKMLFLGQTSREGVLQDLVAIAVQVGADLIHRRSLLQALQARVHEWGLLNGAKSPTMIVLA